MDGRRIGAEERGMDIEVGDEEGRVGDEVRKVGDEKGGPGGEERNPGGVRQRPGGDESAAEGGERSQEIVIERDSLGPVYEFVCISFRTDNLNCFRAS
jgi:hypothetical protein